jgi:hypothetical protein
MKNKEQRTMIVILYRKWTKLNFDENMQCDFSK